MRDACLRPSRDTGSSVVGGDGIVHVDLKARLIASVLARNLGEWAGRAGAGASDGQLGASNVVLGAFKCLSSMQGDVLRAKEVVTGRKLGGQVDREVLDSACARKVGRPLKTSRCDLIGRELVDLEPISRAVVLVGRGSTWSLAHPHRQRTRVGDRHVNGEANVVTGSHCVRRSLGHSSSHWRHVSIRIKHSTEIDRTKYKEH